MIDGFIGITESQAEQDDWQDTIGTDCDCCGEFRLLRDLPGCSFYGPFTCADCVKKLAAGEPVPDKAGYLSEIRAVRGDL